LIGIKRSQVYPKYFGLNHFGWFTGIYDKQTGHDYLPDLLAYVENNYEQVHEQFAAEIKSEKDHWAITFLDHLEMMHDFPYSLPNTYNLYYLYPNRTYKHYSLEHTRTDEVIEGRETMVFDYCKEIAKLQKMKGTKYDISARINPQYSVDNPQAASTVYADNDVHAAYLVELVLSIINNNNDVALVMIKNDGICPNLDEGMMLEVACRIGKEEIVPLHYGPVPAFEKGLLENQYACEKLIVDAIEERSKQKLLQAFTENRVVRDADTAKKLIERFIEVNKEYWPEFK
jgi:alpha-galactosidase/6-phospho-beta-glucosidase family protein